MRRLGIGVLLMLCLGCTHLLYFPTHVQHVDPIRVGLHPESIWFRNENGDLLNGWYLAAERGKRPKAVLVFFHGNGQNLSSHYLTLSWLLKEGYDYFIFDYQGYGFSPGKPTPAGTVMDGRAAIRWVYEKDPTVPVVIFGQSLGGAVALKAAAQVKNEIPLRLIVVDSTFHSYQAAGRKILSSFFLTWPFQWMSYLVLSDTEAPKNDIASLSPIPFLVIHGDQDRTVDFDLGEEVFRRAGEPKTFWRVEGGIHTDAFWTQDGIYRKKLTEFLDAMFGS